MVLRQDYTQGICANPMVFSEIEGNSDAFDNTPSDFQKRILTAAPVVNKFENQNKKDEIAVDNYDEAESSEDDYYDEIGAGGMMMWDDDEDLIPIA